MPESVVGAASVRVVLPCSTFKLNEIHLSILSAELDTGSSSGRQTLQHVLT